MKKIEKNIQKRNEFVEKSNQMIETFDEVIKRINVLTENQVTVPNPARMYKKKIINLDDEWSKYGVNFFLESFASTIDSRLLKKLEESLRCLDIIASIIEQISRLKSMSNGTKTYNRIVFALREQYEENCMFIKDFSVEKCLSGLLLERYSDERYDILTPGSYKNMYANDRMLIDNLGLGNQLKYIEPYFKVIIDAQENMSEKYQSSSKNSEIEEPVYPSDQIVNPEIKRILDRYFEEQSNPNSLKL